MGKCCVIRATYRIEKALGQEATVFHWFFRIGSGSDAALTQEISRRPGDGAKHNQTNKVEGVSGSRRGGANSATGNWNTLLRPGISNQNSGMDMLLNGQRLRRPYVEQQSRLAVQQEYIIHTAQHYSV